MAINQCSLCNDPCIINGVVGNNAMQETWRLLIAQAICALGGQVTPLPEVALGHATLQADYATYADPGFLNSQTKLKRLRVYNTTDAVVEVSLDGGSTTWLSVPAGTDTGLMSLGNVIVSADTDFQIRRLSGDSATSGTLYIQGSY